MTDNEKRLDEMFKSLVPVKGAAGTVAGEIVRAIERLAYRNYNDGDHVGVGYGKETCNAAARYLIEKGNDEIETLVRNLWGVEDDDLYDEILDNAEMAVIRYLENHKELSETKNTEDMFDYYDKDEDVDNDWDSEEW